MFTIPLSINFSRHNSISQSTGGRHTKEDATDHPDHCHCGGMCGIPNSLGSRVLSGKVLFEVKCALYVALYEAGTASTSCTVTSAFKEKLSQIVYFWESAKTCPTPWFWRFIWESTFRGNVCPLCSTGFRELEAGTAFTSCMVTSAFKEKVRSSISENPRKHAQPPPHPTCLFRFCVPPACFSPLFLFSPVEYTLHLQKTFITVQLLC